MVERTLPIVVSETTSTTNGDAKADRVSTSVVRAIADRKNVDPVDLPPLYPEIDLDALDSLFHPSGTGVVSGAPRVTFEAFGCEIVVEGPGRVTVQPAAVAEPRLVE